MNKKVSSESVVKDIRRRTRKKYSSEEKIRIVLDGLAGNSFRCPMDRPAEDKVEEVAIKD